MSSQNRKRELSAAEHADNAADDAQNDIEPDREIRFLLKELQRFE